MTDKKDYTRANFRKPKYNPEVDGFDYDKALYQFKLDQYAELDALERHIRDYRKAVQELTELPSRSFRNKWDSEYASNIERMTWRMAEGGYWVIRNNPEARWWDDVSHEEMQAYYEREEAATKAAKERKANPPKYSPKVLLAMTAAAEIDLESIAAQAMGAGKDADIEVEGVEVAQKGNLLQGETS